MIEDVPFHLWRREVFSKIANNFGGFMETNRRTLTLDNLF